MLTYAVFGAALGYALSYAPILVWLYIVVGAWLTTHLRRSLMRAGLPSPPVWWFVFQTIYWLPDLVMAAGRVYAEEESAAAQASSDSEVQ